MNVLSRILLIFYLSFSGWALFHSSDCIVTDLSLLPPVLPNTYVSNRSTFTYYDSVYVADWSNFKVDYSFMDVSTDQFFQQSRDSSYRGEYLYFSGNAFSNEFSDLLRNIHLDSLIPNRHTMEDLTAYVWITQPSITAALHYDAVYNIFIQLHGYKTVILYPPSDVVGLKVFGRLHPHACQSRLDAVCALPEDKQRVYLVTNRTYSKPSPICETVLESQPLHKIEYDLGPGDILVIPPFWFHKVMRAHAPSLPFPD